jgi:hypothetical protein
MGWIDRRLMDSRIMKGRGIKAGRQGKEHDQPSTPHNIDSKSD